MKTRFSNAIVWPAVEALAAPFAASQALLSRFSRQLVSIAALALFSVAGAPAVGASLTIALPANVNTLDPHKSTDGSDRSERRQPFLYAAGRSWA